MTAFDLDPNLLLPVFNGLLRLLRLYRRKLLCLARRLARARIKNPRSLSVDRGCRA